MSDNHHYFAHSPMVPLSLSLFKHLVAPLFVCPEIVKSRNVIDTFITTTIDFGKVPGSGNRHASFWCTFVKPVPTIEYTILSDPTSRPSSSILLQSSSSAVDRSRS